MDIISILANTILLAPLLLAIDEFGFIVPIGDVIVVITGYAIASGKLSFFMGFIMLLAAVIAGASALYFLSYHHGRKFVALAGEYLDLDMKKIDEISKKFSKYGPLFIIFGRHILGFRIPITIFSGVSRIPYRTFIVSVIISTFFWLNFYLFLGMKFGKRAIGLLHNHQNYILYIFIPIVIVLLLYRFFQKKRKK